LTFGDIEEAERDRKLKWAEQMASGRPKTLTRGADVRVLR